MLQKLTTGLIIIMLFALPESVKSQVSISYSIDPSIALGYGVTSKHELNNKITLGYKTIYINYEGNYGIDYNSILAIYKTKIFEIGYISYYLGVGYGCIFRRFGRFKTYKVVTELNIRLSNNTSIITGWDADGRPELSKQNKHLRLNGTKAQFVGSVWAGIRFQL